MFLQSLLANALVSFRSLLDRIPRSRNARHAARRLLPEWRAWLKIERGLCKGLWFHLNLPAEWSYWAGYHERAVQEILRRLSLPGAIFYDIGAHLGFFSFGVALAVGSEGKVFAFDAEPENCRRFKEIAIRNKMAGQVELIEAAVWSCTSPGLAFRRGSHSKAQGGIVAHGISPVLADGEVALIPTITLDEFIKTGHPVPDIIKIDVEGGECEVLKGAEDLFCQRSPTLVCEVHHQEAAHWIADWLSTKGYNDAVWSIPQESFPRFLVAQRSTRA